MPRRILLLITDLEIGGTPTVVRELAVRLNHLAEVYVEVAFLSRRGPVADQLTLAGIAVTPLGASSASDIWVVRRLIDLIRARSFDTVFSFLIHANAVAAAAKLACEGVRFLQSIQTTQATPAWHWRLQRVIHHAAEKIVVPSPSVAQVAREWAKIPAEKIVVIPNAVDVADFPASPIPSQNPRPYPIGFIGRLDPIKRIPDLIAAVAQLNSAAIATTEPTEPIAPTEPTEPGRVAPVGPKVRKSSQRDDRGDAPRLGSAIPFIHLHIFGDGPERDSLNRQIQLSDLSNTITMHGPIPRPQEALQQIGLLVLPSLSEGFGLVLIEAMAAGVPVIARDVPGVRDVVRHGDTGLLVPSLLIPALAEAIERVIADRDLRLRLIESGRRHVVQTFSWGNALAKYRLLMLMEEKDA